MDINQKNCDRLNEVEVTQMDMLELVDAIEARSRSHPDEDFYAGIHVEVERLFGRTDKADAVKTRFEALARMIEDEVVMSWVLPARRLGERPTADLELLSMVAKTKLGVFAGQIGFNLKLFVRYAGIR